MCSTPQTPEEVHHAFQKILNRISEEYLLDLSTPEGRVRAAKSAYPQIADNITITSVDLDDDGVFTIHVAVRQEGPLQHVEITFIKGDTL